MLRTILLREWKPRTLPLSKPELRTLLAVPQMVSLTPAGAEEEYEIKAKNIVGTLVTPNLRLLIRPKVPLRNLFLLMGYRPDLIQWDPDLFDFDKEPDLLRIFGWVFERQLRQVLPSGLHRDYVRREEALTTIRGRFDLAAQVRLRQGQPLPIECIFDELTDDILINQVTRGALRKLLTTLDQDPELLRHLRFWLRRFNSVSDVGFHRGQIPKPIFSRLNDRWEIVFDLAVLILQEESIRDRAGEVVGTSFTLDMNKLFEKFVERLIEQEARKAGWKFVAQGHRKLSDQILFKPDFLLTSGGRDYGVADAKYKNPEPGIVIEQDIYQLLAYCSSLGLKKGLLVYAGDREHESHRVSAAGIDLDTVGVDLTGNADEIEGSVRAAARKLINAAESQRNEVSLASVI